MLQAPKPACLPASDRWIIPLIDYMEKNIWTDSEARGDVWNDRWTPHLLFSLLGDAGLIRIEQRTFRKALQWLHKLTGQLQSAQRALYGVRHAELLSMEAKARQATVISLRRKRKLLAS